MKFLCMRCDEGMRLEGTAGPHEGSLEATFGCPRCGYKIVMLTNPWETQLVNTLGVKIGGRTTPPAPYQSVLSSLTRPREGTAGEQEGVSEGPSSACPFAEMFEQGSAGGPPEGVQWTDAARVRLERIPGFIRPMVQKAIERYATEQGHRAIDEAVMDEARHRLGM